MIRVILESPYAGNVERNVKYARECVKHSLSLGEAPIASHLLYTQEGILNDDIEHERMLGIDAGLAWKEVAEKHVFYVDYGWSKGMKYAHDYATKNHIPVEVRAILPVMIIDNMCPACFKLTFAKVRDRSVCMNEVCQYESVGT